MYMGKLDCNEKGKKKRPEHKTLQTTESGGDTEEKKIRSGIRFSLFKGKQGEQNHTELTILRQFHKLIPAGVSCPIPLFQLTFCRKGCHI